MQLDLEGSEIEGYRIIKHMANGAYTEVYLATAPNGQDVVLKALNPRLKKGDTITDEQLLWHFQNEIEAMRKVQHSHVVKLLKHGESKNLKGTEFKYLVTEYMCGGTLNDYCQKSSLTLRQVFELFGPVCDALNHMHLSGIIHCDIKPSNLLLDHVANPTLIKLADFSVSKVMLGGQAQDRIPVGTSPYAAPEHHPDATDLERQQPLDARADIYALAITILHALTGIKPDFDRRQITNLAPHPSFRDFKHELERVLGRATALKVDRRYPTINDFWREFKAIEYSTANSDDTIVRAKSRVVVHLESTRVEARHRSGLIPLPEGASIEIVEIPDGNFEMGTSPGEIERWVANFPVYLQKYARESLAWETPHRKVSVKSFWMGNYPVTQRQWRAVAANLEQEILHLQANPWDMRPGAVTRDGEHPVTNISWLDAYEFCARLSIYTGRDIRLPTEAEWEYACRAGTTTPFNCTSDEIIDTELVNYNGVSSLASHPYRWRSDKGTSAVGQVGSPNQFGLCDMHGNVWEWCADTWHENYKRAPVDGSVWDDRPTELLRVARGGSWSSFACACRSASRARFHYNEYFDDLGFRIVI